MKCIICLSEVELFTSSKGFSIFKCKNCGFGFTKDLKLHASNYHRDDTYISEENLFRNIFEKRVNIISRFISQGKVLEVGCSTGLMLSLFKDKGWQVLGVEISKKSAEKALQLGIKVETKSFEDINFNEKFDLIIFNHTLEHLDDPKGVIKKAVSLLNKEGILYIDLPNFGGLSANLQKGNWPLLLPSEHLWHFTYLSLKKILKENNTKIVFNERASGLWDLNNPYKELLIAFLTLKKRFVIEIITAIPSFILTKFKVGSDLMVIAKK